MSDSFVHLHVRSGFSFGCGVATPEELVEGAGRLRMDSLALTDRDGLYGVPRFLEAAEGAGVLPIVGAEVTMAGGGHIVLLCEGMRGYRSLCRLITSYRVGSENRRRPACPLEKVMENAEGLVCLTGAVPFGYVPRLLLAGRTDEAKRTVRRLRKAFGERLYVELTDDETAKSGRNVARVADFARETGLPTVATGEVTYLSPADHRLHEVMMAASNLTALPGPEYRPTDRLYLRSERRMRGLFAGRPEALRNAAEIGERCAGTVSLAGSVHMPEANLGEGESAKRKLLSLALSGIRERYGKLENGPSVGELKGRLRREVRCIFELGFAPYFLIAYEAKEIAREKGIPCTGRGSAANSLVSYCLGLTQPEPFGNRLLFERFLHEGRRDPPDIDLDFCSERRDEVRFEMVRRYKRNGVAEAATVQTMSLRGAVRVAARALGHPPQEVNRLCRHVPTRFRDRDRTYAGLEGWKLALQEPAMEGHPLQDSTRYELLLDLAGRLAGRIREGGTHSGGMVFGTAERHLSELVPLEPSGKDGLLRCQYDKDGLEYVGVPKLDLLGLRMHTALHRAGRLASGRVGREVDPYNLPPEDRGTYSLIRTGKNIGMFQLESPGQMHLSCRLKPRRFSDLVAQISLFRPGPVRGDLVTPFVLRKNGREAYKPILPELEEVLRPTHGVLVYQEQVLAVASAVAGFTLAEGDEVRRSMTGKWKPGAMRGLRRHFVKRARENGIPPEKANEVFGWMEGFSVYGFSAAHAASFAEMSYASAYMRRHYPAEFFCAVLDSQPMGFYSPRTVLNEARRIGIKVRPPDIHLSEKDFAVEEYGTALQVGLRYCKGLSEAEISSVVSARGERPFASVADVYGRTSVEKDSVLNLVKGGYLDALGKRSRLLSDVGALVKKRWKKGQPPIPLAHPASWWTARERGAVEHLPLAESARERMEWSVLGLNVWRHPLAPYREALKGIGVRTSEEVMRSRHGSRVRAAGMMECLQSPPTKSGHRVYFLLIEDEAGLLQATMFRNVYERYGSVLHREGAFLLDGVVERTPEKGFAFLVRWVGSLSGALAGVRVPEPRAVSAPGAFMRAGRRGRRAG